VSFLNHQTLPNVRRFFVPDPGKTIVDSDLDRADLQVVVWEADDDELKAALRLGVDLHLLNGLSLENKPVPPLEELCETHPKYPDHRTPNERSRKFAKAWVHGTNYGGGARTMAIAAGCTVHQSELMQARWFGAHPGIKDWHHRTEAMLHASRTVTNKFGYRRVYFDRPEGLLPEALAWIPQSTVAIYINKVWDTWVSSCPEVEILLQVHDSLVYQVPTQSYESLTARLKSLASEIIIPYDDPLVIPVGFKSSPISWGDCS